MNNKGLKITLISVLGVMIIGIIILLFVGVFCSGEKSAKVESVEDQVEKVVNVKDYTLPDYYSNGSEETKTDTKTTENASTLQYNGDYLIEKSSTIALTEDDLKGLNAQQLTYARNEIYARYGRPFQSAELKQYFQGKSWYHENAGYNDAMVSKLEEANASFIADYQTKTNQEYNPK